MRIFLLPLREGDYAALDSGDPSRVGNGRQAGAVSRRWQRMLGYSRHSLYVFDIICWAFLIGAIISSSAVADSIISVRHFSGWVIEAARQCSAKSGDMNWSVGKNVIVNSPSPYEDSPLVLQGGLQLVKFDHSNGALQTGFRAEGGRSKYCAWFNSELRLADYGFVYGFPNIQPKPYGRAISSIGPRRHEFKNIALVRDYVPLGSYKPSEYHESSLGGNHNISLTLQALGLVLQSADRVTSLHRGRSHFSELIAHGPPLGASEYDVEKCQRGHCVSRSAEGPREQLNGNGQQPNNVAGQHAEQMRPALGCLLAAVAICLLGAALKLGEQEDELLQAVGTVLLLLAFFALYQAAHRGLGFNLTESVPASLGFDASAQRYGLAPEISRRGDVP